MAKTLIQRSREGATPAEKATFAVFGGKAPIRDFFALSARDEQEIETELDRALQVNLERQG